MSPRVDIPAAVPAEPSVFRQTGDFTMCRDAAGNFGKYLERSNVTVSTCMSKCVELGRDKCDAWTSSSQQVGVAYGQRLSCLAIQSEASCTRTAAADGASAREQLVVVESATRIQASCKVCACATCARACRAARSLISGLGCADWGDASTFRQQPSVETASDRGRM